ncbi:unnamed protein product [Vitrella brassicaformis CCMP3155]|uniref:Uncharacterized protein n=2 Tax=Vitrella brassicaformis TaxID=1169539 RepID=A0A0G4FI94_VITBC|nr:unnamed protein product [Vitrella brassicaformis CCMP3155]|eukprot:CEM13059.1 unnamed protein product [Vitrella brassicaformis CCMP3155]
MHQPHRAAARFGASPRIAGSVSERGVLGERPEGRRGGDQPDDNLIEFEQKLAQVVDDYEGLMSLQHNHHSLTLAHKDKRVEYLEQRAKRLQAELEQLRRGGQGGPAAANGAGSFHGGHEDLAEAEAGLMEESVQLLLESRDAEIDLLTQQLHTKQKILEELKNLIHGTAAAQLHQHQPPKALPPAAPRHQAAPAHAAAGLSHASAADQVESLVQSLPDMHEVERLRKEVGDLRDLLVAKDRQLAAVTAVDPNLSEVCAVQLGVQAISMVQNTMELKNQIRTLETRIEQTECCLNEWRNKADQLEGVCDAKRRELIDITRTLADRDQELASLYQLKQDLEREANSQIQSLKDALAGECRHVKELEAAMVEKEGQLSELRNQVLQRDQTITELQEEVARLEIREAEANKRADNLEHQLIQATKNLEKINEEAADSERVIGELEKELNDTKVKLHHSRVKELGRQKRLEMELSQFQHQTKKAIDEKNTEIRALQKEITARSTQLESIRSSICRRKEGCPTPFPPPPQFPLRGDMGDTSPVGGEALDVAGEGGMASARLRPTGSVEVLMPMMHKESRRGGRHISGANRYANRLSYQPPRVDESDGTSLPSFGARGRRNGGSREENGEGEDIDKRVSEYFDQPGRQHLKILLCRLSRGTYLYATHRVKFRVDRYGSLQGRHPSTGDWLPIDDFVEQMWEASGSSGASGGIGSAPTYQSAAASDMMRGEEGGREY